MSTAELAQAKQYSDLAKARLLELEEQAKKAATEPGVHRGPMLARSGPYSASTQVTFVGIVIWERIQVKCDSNPKVSSTADLWGVTFPGGGASWGTTWSSVPFDQLPGLGELTMHCTLTAVMVAIDFWKDGNPVAGFVGGGIAIASGQVGGKCNFVLGWP